MVPINSILIVDDDADMGDVLQLIFTAKGFDVNVVLNGEDAVKYAGKKAYKVVLTDLIMDGIDGIETIKRIKKLSQKTLFFMMTAYPSEQHIKEALSCGAIEVFKKPFNPEDVLERIQKAIEEG